MASIQIHASWASGKTLQAFAKVLQERMKWMNETARGSIAACAIQVLRSIRSVTRVAKLSSIKVEVQCDNTLYPSVTSHSARKTVCIRTKGSNQRYYGKERLARCDGDVDFKTWKVYRFLDKLSSKQTTYLIIAPSQSAAKSKAKSIVRGRQIRYAGLAKRALSVLMMKTVTKTVSDNVPPRVTAKAKELTSHREIIAKSGDGSGGKYALVLDDNLMYAKAAIKGGSAHVDMQMKKAMNKIVSVINQKLKKGGGLFGTQKLETPFNEIARGRR